MYEEYLEDFFYRQLSRVASRICRVFKSKTDKNTTKSNLNQRQQTSRTRMSSENIQAIANRDDLTNYDTSTEKDNYDNLKALISKDRKGHNEKHDACQEKFVDDYLNNVNFHTMMFFLWMTVTIVNVPALLTWAQNFKYSMVLKPDTSYYTGLVMSACTAIVWQMEGPRKNLKNYEAVAALLFTMAIFILALGPFSLAIVNYGVTFMFTIITIQQLYDIEDFVEVTSEEDMENTDDILAQEGPANKTNLEAEETNKETKCNPNIDPKSENVEENINDNDNNDECDVCDENRIYTMFKNLREKFSFNDSVEN